MKALMASTFPSVCDAAAYRKARAFVRDRTDDLRKELEESGFVDSESGMLTTGVRPFNVFARQAAGAMALPKNMVEENKCLEASGHASSFMACSNLPAADANWHDGSKEWLGRASMSKRHRFLTTRDLSWWWFNALVFGLCDAQQLSTAIEIVEAMIAAGHHYTKAHGFGRPAFYFHTYGMSSVNSLHMHMVDLDCTGPTFEALRHKNLPVQDVLKVLREERAASLSPREYARLYLDPALKPALVALARERPADPRTWLAEYLQAHK